MYGRALCAKCSFGQEQDNVESGEPICAAGQELPGAELDANTAGRRQDGVLKPLCVCREQ